MIILGVVVAVWLGERRWVSRGGASGTVIDIAVWAVPFGLIGGRLYHVVTDNQLYFGHGRHPVDALKVWNGGLGIWGAIALGALGAYIGCRRRGISLRAFADATAPGIALAQAIGRWGNWFNQELYGRPTTLPWAVEIGPGHRPLRTPDIATYHPTFLYESLWCVGVAILVIWAEKRFRLAHGRAFALYVAAYTVGRAWIEWLRVDEAHHVLGLRLNDWTALIVFLAAVGYLYLYRGRTEIPEGALGTAAEQAAGSEEPRAPGREDDEEPGDRGKSVPGDGRGDPAGEDASDASDASDEPGGADAGRAAGAGVCDQTGVEGPAAVHGDAEGAAGEVPAEEAEGAGDGGDTAPESGDASGTDVPADTASPAGEPQEDTGATPGAVAADELAKAAAPGVAAVGDDPDRGSVPAAERDAAQDERSEEDTERSGSPRPR